MRNGWVALSLGELTENTRPICYGVLKPGPQVEGGVPLVKITDMDRRILGPEGMQQISNELDHEFRRSRLRGGEVLLSIQGTVGRVAIAALTLKDANISRTIAVIDPDDRLLNLYLMYVLEKIATEGDFDSAGSTRESLNISTIRDMKILCPPIPEQIRIVDLISSVDAYIEALQQQSESAKRSRNAVLHELLTAGGEGWVETTLGEVAHLNPEQARDFDSDRLIKYIDLSTVTFDTGISSEIDLLPFNQAPGRARRIIREKDVIVSTVRPYLKGFAFVGKEFNGQIASTGFCVIRAKSESILSELIWALVGSDDFVDFLIRRSTGSNYPAVRPNDISDFTFILPPLHDQEIISKLITTFDDTIRALSVLISSAQNLRSGLLSDFLSGDHEIPASYDKVIGAA